jgi:hypothetical protein
MENTKQTKDLMKAAVVYKLMTYMNYEFAHMNAPMEDTFREVAQYHALQAMEKVNQEIISEEQLKREVFNACKHTVERLILMSRKSVKQLHSTMRAKERNKKLNTILSELKITHDGTPESINQYNKDITKFKRFNDNLVERINDIHSIDYEYSYPSWLKIDILDEKKDPFVIDIDPLWGRN